MKKRDAGVLAMPGGLFDKMAWGVLLLLALLLPLVISVFPSSSQPSGAIWFGSEAYQSLKYSVFGIGVLLAFASWVLSVCFQKRKVRYSPALILLALYLIWALVSALLSSYTTDAFIGWRFKQDGLIAAALYGMLLLLVIQYVDNKQRMRVLLYAAGAALILVALYGIFQSLGIDFLSMNLPFDAARSSSTIGNPDFLGGYIAITTIMALGLALSEKNPRLRVVCWAAFVLNMWCLVATFTRGAWIGAVIGLLIFAVIVAAKRIKLQKVDWFGIAAAALVVALVVIASFSSPVEDLNAIAKVTDESQARNVSVRFEFWKSAADAIGDKAITGYGLDTYPLFSGKYMTRAAGEALTPGTLIDTPHNHYLMIALGTGVVGLLLWCGFFVWVAVVSGKGIFKRPLTDASVLMLSLWCSCAAFLVFLFVGVTTVATFSLFWMILGLLLAPYSKTANKEVSGWARFIAVPVALVCLMGMFWFARLTYVDAKFTKSIFAQSVSEQITIGEDVHALSPNKLFYTMTLADYYIDRGDQESSSYNQSNKTNEHYLDAAVSDYKRAIELLTETSKKYPDYFPCYTSLAAVYNTLADVTGDDDWAKKALEAAQKAEKTKLYDPAASLQSARAFYLLGDYDEAMTEVEKARETHPDDQYVQQMEQMITQGKNSGKNQ